jgi:hypothetical protein
MDNACMDSRLRGNDKRSHADLAETRDLLLPRLISGELSVEGLPQ